MFGPSSDSVQFQEVNRSLAVEKLTSTALECVKLLIGLVCTRMSVISMSAYKNSRRCVAAPASLTVTNGLVKTLLFSLLRNHTTPRIIVLSPTSLDSTSACVLNGLCLC